MKSALECKEIGLVVFWLRYAAGLPVVDARTADVAHCRVGKHARCKVPVQINPIELFDRPLRPSPTFSPALTTT